MSLLDRLGLEHPIVQAGMGGGVADGALAGAVSAAGALGTVGIMAPPAFAAALAEARSRAPGRPVAANLLAPFCRSAHVRACIEHGSALVVFHGGYPRRHVDALRAAGVPVAATVGTAAEAAAALGIGADALVVQGLEAGGHLVATAPLAEALPAVLAVAGATPVLAAGGIADAGDVRRVLDAGAAAAVAGTRFLLTEESGAHPAYRRRVLDADRTLDTMLFGLGWPLRHRVVPNAATERWTQEGRARPWIAGLARASAPVGRALPLSLVGGMTAAQHPSVPLYGPGLPLAGMPERVLDASALYAGETALRMDTVLPAAEAVAALVP